jgi:hypothetical protein
MMMRKFTISMKGTPFSTAMSGPISMTISHND